MLRFLSTDFGDMKVPNIQIVIDILVGSSWWFQIFFIFTPIWGNDPI